MSIDPNWPAYFRSLAQEIEVQAARVRNLIGERHWPSDGHHKEYLLTTLLKRHVPASVLVSRGFVVDPALEGACSPEQDILIVDSRTHGPLFHQGALLIALPSTIIAAISVKTKLTTATLRDTIKNQLALRTMLCEPGVSARPTWFGGYFFEADTPTVNQPEAVYDRYARATVTINQERASASGPPLSAAFAPETIASAGDPDFIYSVDDPSDASSTLTGRLRVRGFRCGGLATAIFLAITLDHVASRLGDQVPAFSPILDQDCIVPLSPAELLFAPT